MVMQKVEALVFHDTIHLIREKRLFLNIKSSSPSLVSKYKHVSNLVRSKTRMDIKAFSESLCKIFQGFSKVLELGELQQRQAWPHSRSI